MLRLLYGTESAEVCSWVWNSHWFLRHPNSFLWIMPMNLKSTECWLCNAALNLEVQHNFCCVLSSASPHLRQQEIGPSLKDLSVLKLGSIFSDNHPAPSLLQLNPIASCCTPERYPKQFLDILTICPCQTLLDADLVPSTSLCPQVSLMLSAPWLLRHFLFYIPYPQTFLNIFCKSIMLWYFN